jgi:LuxR family maltose regulon positive regulatory protein
MERDLHPVVELTRAFEAELALKGGRISETLSWAKAFPSEQPYLAYMFHIPQLTAAKIQLALDRPDSRKKAAALLGGLHDRVGSSNDKRHQIDVLTLQALLQDSLGDEPAALERLTEAVDLAEPGGIIRTFLDLGPPMADLLKRLSKQKRLDDFIRKLLDAFRDDERGESPDVSDSRAPLPPSLGEQPLIEPLTHREIEILDLLAKRMYSREIADKLFISPETVKTHLRNIYQKLLVKTRREAVDEARKLGILDDG